MHEFEVFIQKYMILAGAATRRALAWHPGPCHFQESGSVLMCAGRHPPDQRLDRKKAKYFGEGA